MPVKSICRSFYCIFFSNEDRYHKCLCKYVIGEKEKMFSKHKKKKTKKCWWVIFFCGSIMRFTNALYI